MIVYLVWTGYEDVEAAFLKKKDAEQWIVEYIRDYPIYAGLRPRVRSDFSITKIWVKQ